MSDRYSDSCESCNCGHRPAVSSPHQKDGCRDSRLSVHGDHARWASCRRCAGHFVASASSFCADELAASPRPETTAQPAGPSCLAVAASQSPPPPVPPACHPRSQRPTSAAPPPAAPAPPSACPAAVRGSSLPAVRLVRKSCRRSQPERERAESRARPASGWNPRPFSAPAPAPAAELRPCRALGSSRFSPPASLPRLPRRRSPKPATSGMPLVWACLAPTSCAAPTTTDQPLLLQPAARACAAHPLQILELMQTAQQLPDPPCAIWRRVVIGRGFDRPLVLAGATLRMVEEIQA